MSARILVVDDVPANVKLLEARLSAEYFDVATAYNGAEALASGGPGETAATLEDTLRFAAWRLERGDAVYVTVGLRIYPGTTLQRIAIDEGVIAGDDSLLLPRFYFSGALALASAVQRMRAFAARYPRFMFSADSRSPILPWLTRAASLMHLPRPHWRYMGVFQRVSRLGRRAEIPG